MNRTAFLVLGLAMAARAGIAQEPSHTAAIPPAPRTVVVRAQWLIDGIADKPRHNTEIVIRDDRIVEVRPANSQTVAGRGPGDRLGAATLLRGSSTRTRTYFCRAKIRPPAATMCNC